MAKIKNLIIVESPSKAHTIEGFMGADWKVESSVGHIRTDTAVDPERDFTVTYEIDPDHRAVVAKLKKAVKSAETVWLASDEDREGEAIAWHLREVLGLPADTRRITYTSIDKDSVTEAIAHPRTVDMDMVASQQARQTLDMLVGFDLSLLVRKKVPGAVSAGRVQSPALRLVVEREREIEQFESKFDFKVSGEFCRKGEKTTFGANLKQNPPGTEAEARKLLAKLAEAKFTVGNVQQTEGTRANPTPLTTAALQIEANARLGFSAGTTMRAAQALYQAGLITYHRTDSLNLSSKALGAIAAFIKKTYGEEYLRPRHFRTKSAGAQEAHEAIRPTNIARVKAGKNDFERKLYHLIRTRTLATQMANARVLKTAAELVPDRLPAAGFEAKGEVVIFDGFLKVYGKSKELDLPELKAGETVVAERITARQNFAKPPARYSEGALVKKLESLGIGRPSTYAGIMNAIQARGYVAKGEGEGKDRAVAQLILENGQIRQADTTEKTGATKGRLLPTASGELVADFLTANFRNIVDYDFTAKVESELDEIAEGKLGRVAMLRAFYDPFRAEVQKAEESERFNGARRLGADPKSGRTIYAKIGRHGGYLQVGENSGPKKDTEKPAFYSLPPKTTAKTVTLEQALAQMALPQLPRTLGKITTRRGEVELIAASGPFGPYLRGGNYNVPLRVSGLVLEKTKALGRRLPLKIGDNADPYTIDLATAEIFYRAKVDAIIHDWGEVQVVIGAYGPYVKGPGRYNNAKIPEGTKPETLTLEEAKKLLAEKPKTRRRGPRRKTAKTDRKKPAGNSKTVAKSRAKGAKK